MSLSPGKKLGPYEIVSQLGAGGMGEVYRARDSKLKRDVAIKVLPADVAADRERLARFQREAEVLASLNHPHIAQVFGLEDNAIVMELVEGDDLSQRILRGAIPIDEALPIARQVAEALEAAHDAGIVHRDLKPANIKVRDDGTVKVLDFGLAKQGSGIADQGSGSLANSPTITSPAMTMRGVILGTAAYMSPEQAKGKAVDKRADIWAFGCVLFEMLAGRRLFAGEDVSEVLAAVLRQEIDWRHLPPDTSPAVTRLLARCLDRDPRRRLRDIGEARVLLQDPSAAATPPAQVGTARGRLRWLPWAIAALSVVIALALSLPYLRTAPPPPLVRFQLNTPTGTSFINRSQVAVSPDGAYLVLAASAGAGTRLQLYLHSFETGETRVLAGTAGGRSPFWSPDSRTVGFFADTSLKRIEIDGGAVRSLATAVAAGTATWNAAGTIVFSSLRPIGLQQVPAEGGTPQTLTLADEQRRELAHVAPQFLPDGVHFLYSVISEKPEANGTFVRGLDAQTATRVLPFSGPAKFSPPNQLLFVRDDALFAQPFDPGTRRVTGEPIRIAPSVARSPVPLTGEYGFSVSDRQLLVVVPDDAAAKQALDLAWYDQAGTLLSQVGVANYRGVELSPDGKTLAAHRHRFNPDGGDIWITDLDGGTDRRLTFDADEDASSPVWSPDGAWVAFGALRGGQWGIYRKPANGAGEDELLFQSAPPKIPMSWAPDGQRLVFVNYDPRTGSDLWILPMSGDRTPSVYLQSPETESLPQISPDGRWIAYVGSGDTWIQSFPVPGTKYQVSENGQPRWRRDGKELFLLQGRGEQTNVAALEVKSSGNALQFGPVRRLGLSGFANLPHGAGMNYFTFDVSADGRRLLLPRVPSRPDTVGGSLPITVLLNWTNLLQTSAQ